MSTAPTEYGYRLGRSVRPRGVELWSRLDRSTRVIGPMGSGKTMRLIAPALREAPGAALATSTKADLYELTVVPRRARGPVVAMDPLRIVPGAEPLRWSPIHGAERSRVAEHRGRAFTAGVRTGMTVASEGAIFYRHRAGSLIMCLLHAAALDGASIRQVLAWSRRPHDPAPRRILDTHPGAEPGWADKLAGIVTGDDRTIGNTMATVEQALAAFDHEELTAAIDLPTEKCTDVRALIRANGTVYALGKDTAYGSVAPLVTAIVEDVLDAAEEIGYERPGGRLDPPFLAALDEAPSIAPIPTLRQRVADGRGRGICVIYAAQGWAGVVARWGAAEAAELAAITSNLVVYGGCKDPDFLHEMERLCGQRRITVANRSRTHGRYGSASVSTQETWEPVLRAHEIGTLDVARGNALVLAENLPPVIARQTALFERRRLWRSVVEPELKEVRAEAARVRSRENPALCASQRSAGATGE
ncbi:type IV secretory system conjugative DNA transfer family protein [Sporichthya polymorpha]|uniref:type IV secretory system conjugative DNA transfer family protein n=1 Tax=Sporichthya polymorpha TaxID=35751 RepID=UPI0003681110|nr:TraM recognition domain-containing protein [Sporichthya polymorpha]